MLCSIVCQYAGGCNATDWRGMETHHKHGDGKGDPLKSDSEKWHRYRDDAEAARNKYACMCGYHHNILTFEENGWAQPKGKKEFCKVLGGCACSFPGCKNQDLRGSEKDHVFRDGQDKGSSYEVLLNKYTADELRSRYQMLCGYHHNIKSYLEKQEDLRALTTEEDLLLKEFRGISIQPRGDEKH